ncbi:hypothetical protein [Sorangium sp. So ce1024]|uniref:hypothetical protein n=1 Tax=Sorangium sp. So ce1024 TaxID=3133327 RepID=UPI003F073ADE
MSRVPLLSLMFTTVAIAAACSPEAPPNELGQVDASFSAGPFTVQPGEDKTICSYVRADNEDAADIAAFLAQQPRGGHHIIVYAVDHPIDSEPHVCTQGGQPGWDTLLVSQQEREEIRFPAGVGYRIGRHQQFVVETHYINASPEPVDVSSRFGVVYAAPGSVRERAATYYFGTMNIDVPPRGRATSAGSCAPPVPMNVRTMFGHQHHLGTELAVQLVPGDGGAPRDIYRSTNWADAPVATFDEGLLVGPSDRLLVDCSWENHGDSRARFPTEMCFAIGYYWPADMSFTCASGGGGPEDQCTCFARGGLDVGPGGGLAEIVVRRAEEVPGAGGPIDAGDAIYCFLYAPEDYGPAGPLPTARPRYFRDAQGAVLGSSEDAATISFTDVTPGSYVASCLMDVVGGGFIAGPGAVVNAAPALVEVGAEGTARAEVVLDYAIP